MVRGDGCGGIDCGLTIINVFHIIKLDFIIYRGSDFSELILASSSEGIFKYSVSFDVHNDGPSPLGANLKIPIASGHLKSDIVKVLYVFIIINVTCFTRIPRLCFRKLVKVLTTP